jgi:ketosteroid isomerase-like protein
LPDDLPTDSSGGAENDQGDPGESSFPAISHYRFRDGRVIESRMFFYDTVAVRDFLIRGEAARLA